MIFFRMFQHLLPNARAWRLTIEKFLRQFFEGLSGFGADVKTYYDLIWLDIFPETTRNIQGWETQFGLPDTGLSDQERIERLDAAWKAQGGQDPRYLQDTLQANGFDVYLHEWWEPGTEPAVGTKQCVIPRNPLLYLKQQGGVGISAMDAGEPLAQAGEPFAQAGNGIDPRGYPLVNKIISTRPNYLVLAGEPLAEAGEPTAEAGNFDGFIQENRIYEIPLDTSKWPYFLYIGAEIFGNMAQVDSKRRDEFETLCLKICPAQQWLGILVEYS